LLSWGWNTFRELSNTVTEKELLNIKKMNCTIPPPEVLKFLPSLPKTAEFSVIRYQLAKSSTSAGANYEESQSGSSRADFLNKVRISLREMRESNYWLRIISTIQNDNKLVDQLTFLIQESEELKNILGAIVSKSNK